jgi:hypothetical protein
MIGKDSADAAGGLNVSEIMVSSESLGSVSRGVDERRQQPSVNGIGDDPNLDPFPFYYYRDHSNDVDPDSLSPLTPPGRVPNFPAKMHAILCRSDLEDIVCWYVVSPNILSLRLKT